VSKWLETDQDNLHMIFSALNVDFSSLRPDPHMFNEACARECQREVPPPKSGYFSDIGLSSVKMIADALYHNKQ